MNADRASDVAHWGLTPREQVDYFGRVSAYWGRRVATHNERAQRYGRIAARLRTASVTLTLVALAILGAKALGWWA